MFFLKVKVQFEEQKFILFERKFCRWCNVLSGYLGFSIQCNLKNKNLYCLNGNFVVGVTFQVDIQDFQYSAIQFVLGGYFKQQYKINKIWQKRIGRVSRPPWIG
eukprot:TRINITY_DN8256_c0_g1_i4.p2 TRINITY_DN8256_c0_g1~~TRINITY_DN8256_c0_g1_i4.p2  ORF type:complete len:104 (-),score=11.32 TRINITY_DN8256_c0_g1_i4:42-353(-)